MNVWQLYSKPHSHYLVIKDREKFPPFTTQIDAVTINNPVVAKLSAAVVLNDWHPEEVIFRYIPESFFSRFWWYKPKHFIMLAANLVCISETAYSFMRDNFEDSFKLLPIHEYSTNRAVHLVYVTKVIDCLNEERSELLRASDDGRILLVTQHYFNMELLDNISIFKLPYGGNVFVTETFIKKYYAAKLNDLQFRRVF
jgi:hypothetical protein